MKIFYYLILLILKIIAYLPQKIQIFLAHGIAFILYYSLQYRRKVCEFNLKLVFPEKSASEREKLLKNHFFSMAMGIVEMSKAWFLSPEKLRQITDFECDADSLAILNSQRGVILAGAHSTLLELGVRLLGLYIPASGMYRPIKNDFFNTWIKKQREKAAHSELVHFKDLRHTLKVLKDGKNLWYAMDQDMGKENSVFVDFFSIPSASINIFSKLQEKTGAAIIPVYFWRQKNGRYLVKIGAEIKGNSPEVIMTEANKRLEQEIRQYPEQYYWLHRRFKTLPDGSRRDYPSKK